MTAIQPPFPYFGGKRRVTKLVWSRLGRVRNYVEPFFGSGAMLFGRPTPFDGVETVNDADGLLANFWRAVRQAPDDVAVWADWPVNENDLHARHAWLVGRKDSLQERLEGDPEFFDAKVAGWWVWGACCWIGSGWCSGTGPWQVVEQDGARKLVHVGDAGRGINRKLVHVGDAGRGINRKLVHVGNAGQGVNRKRDGIEGYFDRIAERLRRVRVCCGDWSRVCGESVTVKHGTTAVFLDPPYADEAERSMGLYRQDSGTVAHAVREWAIANGDHPDLRICLCGYEGEHAMPESWECIAGKAGGGHGFGGQAKEGYANEGRERLWFSPHCVRGVRQTSLFTMGD